MVMLCLVQVRLVAKLRNFMCFDIGVCIAHMFHCPQLKVVIKVSLGTRPKCNPITFLVNMF